MMAAPLETMAPVVVAKRRLSNMVQFSLGACRLLCSGLRCDGQNAGQARVFALTAPAMPPRQDLQGGQLGDVAQVAAIQQAPLAEVHQRCQIADHALVEDARKLRWMQQAVLA